MGSVFASDKEIHEQGISNPSNTCSLTKNVLETIKKEPAYRIVLYKILDYCQNPYTDKKIEQLILSFPEMKTAMHSPKEILTWLEEAGGIERIDDGDEAVWRTTEAGKSVVQSESFQNQIKRLIINESDYKDIYLMILKACLVPKSRTEIESLVNGSAAAKNDSIFASYFVEQLEKSGGLEWVERWRTTAAGKELVEQYSV